LTFHRLPRSGGCFGSSSSPREGGTKTDPRREPTPLLNEIVSTDPLSALYLPLAERLREEGRLEEAILLCEERRDRPHAGVGDRIVTGRCYLAAGRLPEARREFEQALRLDRENVSALKALAGILAHEGHDRASADLYRAVCRIDPGDLESQTALHQISSGDFPEVRSPDVLIGQGELTWQPVRLPREEEHLTELSLGLRNIETFDPEPPKESTSNVQEFREIAVDDIDSPGEAGGTGEAVAAPRGESNAAVERLKSEVARARKAPVEKSMDQNRGAFEEWLKRIHRGSDR
jgi:tetratricopeptide (TPR) repeat protein